MNTLDIRIFGVEERMSNIDLLRSQLPPSATVIIDTDHDGIIPTAKFSWLLPTTSSHIMVLNDDVELCDGFVEVCTRMINTHPCCVFSLFSFLFMDGERTRRGGFPKISPYVEVNQVSGLGVIIPTNLVHSCINSWSPDAKHDDTAICNWALNSNIRILTTLPGVVQHLDFPSTVGHPPLVSTVFNKHPEANWESTYITNWSNIT